MDTTADLPSCLCSECWGLQEYGLAHGKDYGLPRAPGCGYNGPVKLSVLTFGATPDNLVELPRFVTCDGSMTCPCDDCSEERLERVRRGGEGAGRSQIKPGPPRALRGAAA